MTDRKPWRAVRAMTPTLRQSAQTSSRPGPPSSHPAPFSSLALLRDESVVRLSAPPPEPCDVDLSALDEGAVRRPGGRVEKSTWDSRAMLALELSKLGAFSKADADAVVAEAERTGMALTKDRSHVVVFDGQNFSLTRNTLATRAFFRLDSFLRRMVAR